MKVSPVAKIITFTVLMHELRGQQAVSLRPLSTTPNFSSLTTPIIGAFMA